TRNISGLPRPGYPAGVEGIPRNAGSESHRGHHPLDRGLDADFSAGDALHYSAAKTNEAILVDRAAPHVWAVRILLRLPAPDDIRVAGQVLQRTRNARRRGEATLHNSGTDSVRLDGSAGADLHERLDSATGRQTLA